MRPDSIQTIAAAVTPAVMVSACGLIALGLDNQVSRMSLRLRDLTDRHRTADQDPARRALLAPQVRILFARHRLLARALALVYCAILLFVLTSLLFLGQVLLPIPAAAPLTAFTLGFAFLASVAVFVLGSLRLSSAAIAIETASILNQGPRA